MLGQRNNDITDNINKDAGMWYENKMFVIVMMVLSGLMLYASVKRAMLSFEKAKEDLDESKAYAEKYGKHAILAFTIVTVLFTIGYIVSAYTAGLIDILPVIYALIIMKCFGLMIEYGALQGTWQYNKASFAFDQIQCWINVVTAIYVVARFFLIGLVTI